MKADGASCGFLLVRCVQPLCVCANAVIVALAVVHVRSSWKTLVNGTQLASLLLTWASIFPWTERPFVRLLSAAKRPEMTRHVHKPRTPAPRVPVSDERLPHFPLWNLTCPVLSYWVCVPAWLVSRQDYWTCAYPCVNAFVHEWQLSKRGKGVCTFPVLLVCVWLCVPSILPLLYLLLLPVFFLTHSLFLLKHFYLFLTTLWMLWWWLVESGNVSHFPTNNLKISSSLVVWLHHMRFFFLQHLTTVAPFVLLNLTTPDSVKSTHCYSQKGGWCVLFLTSRHRFSFLYGKVAPYLHYSFQSLQFL